VAILLGGLVLMSLVMERGVKTPSPASVAAVGGRRMVIGANGRLADQRTVEDLMRDGDDPLSGSKRRVPNGPDPIHNRYLLFLACKLNMECAPRLSLSLSFFRNKTFCSFFSVSPNSSYIHIKRISLNSSLTCPHIKNQVPSFS